MFPWLSHPLSFLLIIPAFFPYLSFCLYFPPYFIFILFFTYLELTTSWTICSIYCTLRKLIIVSLVEFIVCFFPTRSAHENIQCFLTLSWYSMYTMPFSPIKEWHICMKNKDCKNTSLYKSSCCFIREWSRKGITGNMSGYTYHLKQINLLVLLVMKHGNGHV